MSLLHVLGHGPQDAVVLVLGVEEAALEAQLDLAPLLVDLGVHDEQAVALARAGVSHRAVAAAHGDGRGRLLDDLEVVCYSRAGLVGGGRQVARGPELVGGLGLVLVGEDAALGVVAWIVSKLLVFGSIIHHIPSAREEKRREA